MAVVSALAVTGLSDQPQQPREHRRDRQALAALATSEAGVAQAIAHIRTGSIGSFGCRSRRRGLLQAPPARAPRRAGAVPQPKQVRLDGASGPCTSSTDCYRVWIGTVRPYVANLRQPLAHPATAVHRPLPDPLDGVSGNGPGARQVAVDVEVQPFPFPLGIFAESFSGSGQMVVQQQSLFTTGCVQNRVKDNGGGSGRALPVGPG
jgi:hypothetical protein